MYIWHFSQGWWAGAGRSSVFGNLEPETAEKKKQGPEHLEKNEEPELEKKLAGSPALILVMVLIQQISDLSYINSK